MSKSPDVYHAIADPNRRKLLEMLCKRECSVQELMPHFNITMGGISQHLRILLETGLVARRKRGRFRYYSAKPRTLREVHEWTEQYRRFWERSLDRFGDFLDNTE